MAGLPWEIVVSAEIAAPPARLYGLIADYRAGHPRIIPRPPFGPIEVLEGGTGAGTRFRCSMTVLGKSHSFEAVVAEPEPGRLLTETDVHTGLLTRFRVEPSGAGARVTLHTIATTRAGGLAGRIERWYTLRFLRGLYASELAQLARVAASSPD